MRAMASAPISPRVSSESAAVPKIELGTPRALIGERAASGAPPRAARRGGAYHAVRCVKGPCISARHGLPAAAVRPAGFSLQVAWPGEPVEVGSEVAPSEHHGEGDVRFQRWRVVEPADVQWVEAGVTDELLSERARVGVGGEDARRREALVCDLVVGGVPLS
jgi:hypothetical protein